VNGLINRHIFSQLNVDSGSITPLTSVTHRFSEAGEHFAVLRRAGNIVGRFKIIVAEEANMEPSLKIDLQPLELPPEQHFESEKCNCYRIKTGGTALFYVSSGAGRYSLEIHKANKDKSEKVFDNHELKAEDLYIVTLLRPGSYQIRNTLNDTQAELTIVYPEIGKTARNVPPQAVECGECGITPNKICLNPAQALIFCLKVPSRIKIVLVKPEDRVRSAESKKPRQTAAKPTVAVKRRLRIIPS
jgi:hypothetical protein